MTTIQWAHGRRRMKKWPTHRAQRSFMVQCLGETEKTGGGGVEVGERGRMGVVGCGIIRKDKAVTIERRGDLEH
jgi:hypothetical protein